MRIDEIEAFAKLIAPQFKVVRDDKLNQYILFDDKLNMAMSDLSSIDDHTAFEATQNHIHLLDNIKASEIIDLEQVSHKICTAFLQRLKECFPQREFCVYITLKIGDSMVFRFHQKWKDEYDYYDDSESYPSDEYLIKIVS